MADIKSRNVLVLDSKEPEAGEKFNKNGWVLRVVEWEFKKSNGDAGKSVKLEKRELFIKDGNTASGKAVGFTVADLDLIVSRADEIKSAMLNPDAVAKKDEDEQIPF